jgi:hypothetical protein
MSDKVEEIRAMSDKIEGIHARIATLLAKVDRFGRALQTIRDQGGDVVERWSSEIARKALEDKQ